MSVFNRPFVLAYTRNCQDLGDLISDCPICRHSRSLAVPANGKFIHCFACGFHGQAVNLVEKTELIGHDEASVRVLEVLNGS